MKITFLLARRVPDKPSPVMVGLTASLTAAGHQVDGWIPEDRCLSADSVAVSADRYVLKSHTEHALSYAAALRDAGADIRNDLDASLLAQDKVTAVRRLRSLGVPAPDTWLVAEPLQAASLLAGGAMILKPNRGHRGADVHLAADLRQLEQVPAGRGPYVAQRFVPGPGEDLKVYVAGEHVWAVRKPFDPMSFTRSGRPVRVSREVEGIAQRVRTGFGLELFGIDVIESPDGPMVVDVNYFPGYKGCPDPVPAIAAAIASPSLAAVS